MPAPILTRTARPMPSVVAPLGFLGVYLAAGPISDALADRPMPLPTAPAADTVAYLAADLGAALVLAALQLVSVACFGVFVAHIAPLLRDTGRGALLPAVGYVSVAAMVVSSLCAGASVWAAGSGAVDLVAVLRQASFFAGGVGNVVTLGVFVVGTALVLGGRGLIGRTVRGFGYVAGAVAVASVLSLGIYYASVGLPVGRVLSMLWTVVAGIVLARGRALPAIGARAAR